MKFLKFKSTISDKTRTYLSYLVYIVFFFYSINIIVNAESMGGKVLIGIIAAIFLSVTLLGEYLKHLQRNLILTLAYKCQVDEVETIMNKIKRLDIFHSYKEILLTFETLYNCDIDKPQDNLDLLQSNEKLFLSSLDYCLVYNYTSFYSFYRMGNKTKAKKYYNEFIKMKDLKIKRKKVSSVYSWEFATGTYYSMIGDYKKSKSSFQKCDLDTFNHREQALYYLEYMKVCKQIKDTKTFGKLAQKAVKLEGNSAILKEIKEL
ncbi:hypothetical protein [Breznakia pachnodae]|uniref:Tetratricopeptide repeat protein n=1 Tax=Breznakia pachnodae TaxID=265178 RepID=A0ABU0E1C0_9FIRM|nr:hypothetical protein [Breznakia pachnodae]MDQ0360676.1 hypothetical protein [Breznakia pachnodae]